MSARHPNPTAPVMAMLLIAIATVVGLVGFVALHGKMGIWPPAATLSARRLPSAPHPSPLPLPLPRPAAHSQ